MDRDYGMSTFFKTIDTVLMGRKTHDFAVEHGMPVYPGMKNYVLTHQQGRDTFGGAVEYVSDDVAELVRRLRGQRGKGIWIVGGVGIVNDLFRAGLVDEVMLAVHPRLLGAGVRLFSGALPETELRLRKHNVWDNGLVSLEYEVVR
jgi:dihydrofolate reductase